MTSDGLQSGIRSGGSFGSIATPRKSDKKQALLDVIGNGLNVRGYTLLELKVGTERFEAGKRDILDGLGSGALKPIIVKTFPLSQIVEAHRYLESNQQVGKIVVTVD